MGKTFCIQCGRLPSCYLPTIFLIQLASNDDDEEDVSEDENDENHHDHDHDTGCSVDGNGDDDIIGSPYGGSGGYPDHSIFGRKPKLLLQLMTDNCIIPSTPATPIRAQHEFWSLNALKCSNTKVQRKIYLVQITLQL